jgi:hypothetical protein
MPTFEQSMAAMSKMSPEEIDSQMAQLTKICICGKCPSYIGTGEKKLVFCLIGKSTIIKKEMGCICMKCPVTAKIGLKWSYYCIRGSGKEQATKKK